MSAPPGGHRSEHVVTNLTLQLDGDMATDQAYWQTIVTRDCKSVVAGAGHYEDVLKREDGRWKFFKREIIDDIPPRPTPAPARRRDVSFSGSRENLDPLAMLVQRWTGTRPKCCWTSAPVISRSYS